MRRAVIGAVVVALTAPTVAHAGVVQDARAALANERYAHTQYNRIINEALTPGGSCYERSWNDYWADGWLTLNCSQGLYNRASRYQWAAIYRWQSVRYYLRPGRCRTAIWYLIKADRRALTIADKATDALYFVDDYTTYDPDTFEFVPSFVGWQKVDRYRGLLIRALNTRHGWRIRVLNRCS